MLPSPSSSPIFAPRTNTLHTFSPRQPAYLPTPPSDSKLKKRQLLHDTIKPQKRLKLDLGVENQQDDVKESDEDEDVYMEPPKIARLRARQNTRAHNILSQFMINPSMSFRRPARTSCLLFHFPSINWYCLVSTLPILRSFVSSNKFDLFKCQSVGEDTYLTPPYACAFSHGTLPVHSISPTAFDTVI